MSNAITWFELFVTDMDRACRFYESTLGVTLRREIFGDKKNAVFPHDAERAGGALVLDPRRAPGGTGCLVYLDASGNLDACIDRVAKAGGKVLLPKTDIGDPGFIALIRDTEGNEVGLHAAR